MSQKFTRIVAIIALTALGACSTMEGLGKDISKAGQSITKTAS